jgi:hypothetical protein
MCQRRAAGAVPPRLRGAGAVAAQQDAVRRPFDQQYIGNNVAQKPEQPKHEQRRPKQGAA